MIYIISGLPRSGTSLLMQIMKEGGKTIATDGERLADKNNPLGYYEVEGIMQKLKETPSCIDAYEGMVLKLICYGLPFLPPRNYKVVYIERNIGEVLASMEKMDGKKIPDQTAAALIQLNEKMKQHIQAREDMKALFVAHDKMITQDEQTLHSLQKFCDLQGDFANIINQDLYRNVRVHRNIAQTATNIPESSQEQMTLDKLRSLGYL
ncbi:MAG: nucleotide pyrophosphatase [Candidatus Omnitrophica bacterium]|nr:nucleotide pyrophosphatase [Candidatus Omnitrophota bacterium]